MVVIDIGMSILMNKKETRKLQVVPYDPDWEKQFSHEESQIKKALGDVCLAVHHVGSTSVPGLAAKPKIDILVVIKPGSVNIDPPLHAIGYETRGEFNLPLQYSFAKRGKIDVNLHIFEEGHPEIELNLTFRDYLRTHPETCKEYALLKSALLKEESSFEKNHPMFTGYTLGKAEFIRNVLRLSGFCRLRFVRPTNINEWEKVKKLRQHYFFDKANILDPYQWTFDHPDHVHFILYLGVEIIGYAHIQLWPGSRAAIRIIVVEEGQRNRGFGRQFMEWIEIWLKRQGFRSVHTEAAPDAVQFYAQLGYTPMPFNDPDGYESNARDTPLGKIIGAC